MILTTKTPFFVIDVESIGLHGEGFAVGGGVYIDGEAEHEFLFSCYPGAASDSIGMFDPSNSDRLWVGENIDLIRNTGNPYFVRERFWKIWEEVKNKYPGITMAGECIVPVEANFIARCIAQGGGKRNWEGPYPFHDISSIMLAAGMDPMETYERLSDEQPAHNPLCDARQSARLLAQAIRKLASKQASM